MGASWDQLFIFTSEMKTNLCCRDNGFMVDTQEVRSAETLQVCGGMRGIRTTAKALHQHSDSATSAQDVTTPTFSHHLALPTHSHKTHDIPVHLTYTTISSAAVHDTDLCYEALAQQT